VRPELPPQYERDDNGYPPRYRGDFDARRPYSRDEDHLRILSILHYLFGALAGLYCSTPLIHVFIGFLMVSGNMDAHAEEQIVGWLFIGIGGAIVALGWIFAALVVFVGYSLSQRKRYMLCFVTACLCCMHVPLGTVLGVFTILVLARPSVKDLFDRGAIEAQPAREGEAG